MYKLQKPNTSCEFAFYFVLFWRWSADLTSEAAIEVGVCCYLEAWMRQQVAADVGEAGVNVFPDILQLLVLVLLHLNRLMYIRI